MKRNQVERRNLVDPKWWLDRLEINQYDRWLIEQACRYMEGSVAEISCGAGNMTGFLIEKCDRVVAVDVSALNLQFVQERLECDRRLTTIQADVGSSDFLEYFDGLRVNNILSANTLEHVADDVQALSNFYHLLPRGGTLFLVVPTQPRLYNRLDHEVGHYRRYTLPELARKVRMAGFQIDRLYYTNPVGTIGWWLNGVRGAESIPGWQLRFFNKLTPFLLKLELGERLPFGLSAICVARKPRLSL